MVSKCVLISSSLAWILSSRSCIVYWEQGKLVTNSYSNISIDMKRSNGVYSPCSLYSPAALLTQVLRKDFPLKASSASSVLVAVSSVPSSCYKTPISATGIYCYAPTIGLCLSVKERHPCRSYLSVHNMRAVLGVGQLVWCSASRKKQQQVGCVSCF